MMKLVVLSCLLAAATANLLGPIGYGLGYAAPYGGLLGGYNYRGPLSLPPGQPANIIAADGRPLDTWAVNADRTAHYTARALEGSGVHLLKKRSAALVAPLALNRVAVPLTYSTPVLSNPIVAPYTWGAAPAYW